MIKSQHKDLLNNLSRLQETPHYHTIKHTLYMAEQTILSQEMTINSLKNHPKWSTSAEEKAIGTEEYLHRLESFKRDVLDSPEVIAEACHGTLRLTIDGKPISRKVKLIAKPKG